MRAHKKKDTFGNDHFLEKKCPVCGKTFCPAPLHVYKLPTRNTRVCSYHCMLEAERKHEDGRKKPGRKKKNV